MNKEFYITNCIIRILLAPCSNRREVQRSRDLARGVTIAASAGLDKAHEYFSNLCDEAEKGRYGGAVGMLQDVSETCQKIQ
jgi:hypothetical protein